MSLALFSGRPTWPENEAKVSFCVHNEVLCQERESMFINLAKEQQKSFQYISAYLLHSDHVPWMFACVCMICHQV